MRLAIRDVADAAGVAPSTVSRVLNHRDDPRIGDRTRKRVLAVASEMGYKPDRHAQALVTGSSTAISIVTSSYSNRAAVDAERVLRIHRVTGEFGRQIVSTDLARSTSPDVVVESILAERPEISLWASIPWYPDEIVRAAQMLYEAGVGVLIVDQREVLAEDIPADVILVNRAATRYLATKHLVELGHRDIGLLTSGDPYWDQGYVWALEEAGLSDRYHEPVTGSDDAPGNTRIAVERLLQRYPQVTAMICRSDLHALVAMRVLSEAGYSVPEHMSIVGYRNEEWAAHLPVSLTTVAHPLDELELATRELLQRRLEERDAPWRQIELELSLVVRQSTGPPRSRDIGGGQRPEAGGVLQSN